MNTYNTLVAVYDGTKHNIIELDKESFQKVSDLKRNKHRSDNQLKKIIFDIEETHISLSYKLYKELKKEIDEIIILAYNNSHPYNYNKDAKNYNSESFTEYFEKELGMIGVRADTIEETYSTLKHNLKEQAIITGATVLAGCGAIAHNIFTPTTIANFLVPIGLTMGVFINYVISKNNIEEEKQKLKTEKDKHDTVNNIINRIKNKATKLTIIKPNKP